MKRFLFILIAFLLLFNDSARGINVAKADTISPNYNVSALAITSNRSIHISTGNKSFNFIDDALLNNDCKSLFSNNIISATALTYTVTISSTGNGKVEYAGTVVRSGTKEFSVEEGGDVTIVSTPDEGYRVKNVKRTNEGYISNSWDYTDRTSVPHTNYLNSNVKTNVNVEVVFEKIPDVIPTYTVTISSTGNGKVEYASDVVRSGTKEFTVEEGGNVTIVSTPDEGYRVKKVKKTDEGYISNSWDYTDMTSIPHTNNLNSNVKTNVNVEVVFERIPGVDIPKNIVYLSDVTTAQNTTKQISVKLKNDSQITNFQFDVYLPTGVTMVTSGGNYVYAKGSRLTSSHSITCAQQSDGAYRFFCYSASNALFSGNDGEIMNFMVKVPNSTVTGEYTITIKNAKVSEPNGTKYTTENTSAKLTVTPGSVSVTGITLNSTSASLIIGETKSLIATITPSNATNKNVTWSSSNTSVATVSNTGVVTAVGVGNVTITCKATDGSNVSATCAVSVITDGNDVNDDTDVSSMANAIYVQNIEATKGNDIELSIRLKNSTMDVNAFSFNLELPAGFTVTKVARGERLRVQDDDDEYLFKFENSNKDGVRYVQAYTSSDAILVGKDGEIAKVTVSMPQDIVAGTYPVMITGGEIAVNGVGEQLATVKSTLTVKEYIPGDANGDGRVSITDISAIATYLLGNSITGFTSAAADVNGDGRVSITDISALASKLLGK